MPTYDPTGRITFSRQEKESLQAQANAAGISLAQQIKLLLVRGLPVTDDNGDRYIVGVDLSQLGEPLDTSHHLDDDSQTPQLDGQE